MSKNDDSKVFAFLGVFLTIIGFIIVLLAKKEDKYAMFYAKQGLVLFILQVILWIVGIVLIFIPVLGWIISALLWVGLLVLWIIGIIYSFSGQEKDIPVVGSFARKLKI